MSKIKFSEKDKKKLEKNKNVKRVSELAITYTEEFKIKFIEEYLNKKMAREIFEENGFEVEVLGVKRIEQSASRWKKCYEEDGILGLMDRRSIKSGRSLKRTLS
jgi:putative transposase